MMQVIMAETRKMTIYCVTWEHPEKGGGQFFLPANSEDKAKTLALQALNDIGIRPTQIISVEIA